MIPAWKIPGTAMEESPFLDGFKYVRIWGWTQIRGWIPQSPRAFPTSTIPGFPDGQNLEHPTGMMMWSISDPKIHEIPSRPHPPSPDPCGIPWDSHLELQLGSQEVILGWRLVHGPAGLWGGKTRKGRNSSQSKAGNPTWVHPVEGSGPSQPSEAAPGMPAAPGFWEAGAGCSSPAPWPAPSPSGKCHCGEGTGMRQSWEFWEFLHPRESG